MTYDEQQEAEANYFAMCLLMPEPFVRTEVEKMGARAFDLADDRAVAKLAEKFKVSISIMAWRLNDIYGREPRKSVQQ